MKQVIDITTPDGEEVEEQFPAVLTSSKPQKKSGAKKKAKPSSDRPPIKEEKKKEEKREQKEKRKKEGVQICFTVPRFALKLPLIIGIVLVLLGGAFVYLSLQAKAMVSVRPLLEPIKIEEEIQISSSQDKIDPENKIIPGFVIEKEVEKWETFKATGKATEQSGASGSIFVYNNINPPAPLSLKQGTRFVSSKDGKTYKAKDKISLPPAILAGGKLTPSITEVQVVADKEGEEYNIAPAKFSVPGLAGTALYYNIWAESREKIEGGSQEEVAMITQQDIDNAQESLIRSLKEMALGGLKEQVAEGSSFNKESVDFMEPEVSCSQAPGTNLADFDCYAKLKAKAIVFKEADLKEISLSFIDTKLSSTKRLYEQSLDLSITPRDSLTEKGSLNFNLKADAKLYNEIDQEALVRDIAGKSEEDMEVLLNNSYPQIERMDTQFWPFWIKKAPKNLDKIKLEMVF